MADKIKSVKATCNYIVLKAEEIKETVETKKTAGGLLLQTEVKTGQNINKANNNGKARVKLIVQDIGPDVEMDKLGYKIGDEVIINDYDAQTIGDEENTFVLCKANSVKVVVETE
jgi:co-chaperonin GroES (HSP10)